MVEVSNFDKDRRETLSLEKVDAGGAFKSRKFRQSDTGICEGNELLRLTMPEHILE
jgi:hypothetical protein